MPEEETGVQVLSPEEVQQLVRGSGGPESSADRPQLQTVPATIYRVEGDPVVVADYNSWFITTWGPWVSDGQFNGEGESYDLLIPWNRVDWIEYDFSDIEEQLEKAEQSSIESTSPAEGEANAPEDGDSSSD